MGIEAGPAIRRTTRLGAHSPILAKPEQGLRDESALGGNLSVQR
jgi:hypothetical protein